MLIQIDDAPEGFVVSSTLRRAGVAPNARRAVRIAIAGIPVHRVPVAANPDIDKAGRWPRRPLGCRRP